MFRLFATLDSRVRSVILPSGYIFPYRPYCPSAVGSVICISLLSVQGIKIPLNWVHAITGLLVVSYWVIMSSWRSHVSFLGSVMQEGVIEWYGWFHLWFAASGIYVHTLDHVYLLIHFSISPRVQKWLLLLVKNLTGYCIIFCKQQYIQDSNWWCVLTWSCLQLVEAFQATLQEVVDADLLLVNIPGSWRWLLILPFMWICTVGCKFVTDNREHFAACDRQQRFKRGRAARGSVTSATRYWCAPSQIRHMHGGSLE